MRTLSLAVAIFLIIGASLLFAYSDSDDNRGEKYSQESSYTFSPGYVNAAFQQAQTVLRQANSDNNKQNPLDRAIEYAKNKLNFQTKQESTENANVNPVLQKKSSSSGSGKTRTAKQDVSITSAKDLGNGKYEVTLQQGNKSITKEIAYDDYNTMLNQARQQKADEVDAQRALAYALFYNDISSGWEFVTVGSTAYVEGFSSAYANDLVCAANGWHPTAASFFAEHGHSFYEDSSGYYLDGAYIGTVNYDPCSGFFGGEYNVNLVEYDTGYWRQSISNPYAQAFIDSGFYAQHDSGFYYGGDSDNPDGYLYYGARDGSEQLKGSWWMSQFETDILPEMVSMETDSYITGISLSSASPSDYLSYRDSAANTYATTYASDYYTQKTSDWAISYATTLAQQPVKSEITNYALRDNSAYNGMFSGEYFNTSTNNSTNPVLLTPNLSASTSALTPAGLLTKPEKGTDGELVTLIAKAATADGIADNTHIASGEKLTDAKTTLTKILGNPNEDQKTVLDAVKALLKDTNKEAEEAAAKGNPELKKAENDLLQAVANLLLAQAMPELIKKGDMAGIKTIFSDLDAAKTKLMNEYAKSTRPYYDNMLKDLARNLAMLQLKNILKPNMSKDELEKLPPSELDKILEKIKQQKDRAFEEEYLLQQEAKYRQTYIEPSKKNFETGVKEMLNDFTRKINSTLK